MNSDVKKILRQEVTIDEQVITDRENRWHCRHGHIHEDDVEKLAQQICQLESKPDCPDCEDRGTIYHLNIFVGCSLGGCPTCNGTGKSKPEICNGCPTFYEGCEGSNQEDCERGKPDSGRLLSRSDYMQYLIDNNYGWKIEYQVSGLAVDIIAKAQRDLTAGEKDAEMAEALEHISNLLTKVFNLEQGLQEKDAECQHRVLELEDKLTQMYVDGQTEWMKLSQQRVEMVFQILEDYGAGSPANGLVWQEFHEKYGLDSNSRDSLVGVLRQVLKKQEKIK